MAHTPNYNIMNIIGDKYLDEYFNERLDNIWYYIFDSDKNTRIVDDYPHPTFIVAKSRIELYVKIFSTDSSVQAEFLWNNYYDSNYDNFINFFPINNITDQYDIYDFIHDNEPSEVYQKLKNQYQ